ncbi:unnamed protein product [Macrosiphum euphorbiae]|uniref:Uncharacterized protein n=1 Tax=Macrosiphum euphorbiae TaxID=13131 RepID=A0AAV0WBT2_9HEMI|nr:unnamed protein product [Macrosiphum euphorbiae]
MLWGGGRVGLFPFPPGTACITTTVPEAHVNPRVQRGNTTILLVTDDSSWVEPYPLGKVTTKLIVGTFELELFGYLRHYCQILASISCPSQWDRNSGVGEWEDGPLQYTTHVPIR